MNYSQTLIDQLRTVHDKPIPLVVFGTRHARRRYGPEYDAEAIDEDCIDELRQFAVLETDCKVHELDLIETQDYEFKLKNFHVADVFVFGTSKSDDVLKKLAANDIRILSLFPPDASGERIAHSIKYSRVIREEGKIWRSVNTRKIDGKLDSDRYEVIRFQNQYSNLYPEEESPCSYNMRGKPAGFVTYEISEAGTPGSEASTQSDQEPPETITEWVDDTWGTYRGKHWYFFHLVTTDLVSAIEDAIPRLPSLTHPDPDDEPKWPAKGKPHPKNWRKAALGDDVPVWPGEAEFLAKKKYTDDAKLELDRWLFWKWQCGRFDEVEIVESALERGYEIGEMTADQYEKLKQKDEKTQKIKLTNLRGTARHYAEDYAKHFGLERRPGRGRKPDEADDS